MLRLPNTSFFGSVLVWLYRGDTHPGLALARHVG
jgi:hypothetical protein